MRQALLFYLVLLTGTLSAQVVITEINYNNPGADDFEFLELTNAGNAAVNMAGFTFTSGITYTFPNVMVMPGEFVVLTEDAAAFQTAFGGSPLQWDGGSLSNGGESIVLVDAGGLFADSVRYDDAAPWPTAADGDGPSLILCDVNADNNDAANWQASGTATGVFTSTNTTQEILASPGVGNSCATDPQVGFFDTAETVNEDVGTISVGVVVSIGAGNPTNVTIEADAASTADADDYGLDLPLTVTFDGSQADDTVFFDLVVNDDTDQETSETLILTITSVDNSGMVFGNAGTYTLTILDNDTPLTNAMVITGVFDAQPGAAGAKGIELQALADIPDASIFGIGSANNGGGTDGVEFTFPAIDVPAGTCVHIAADSALFNAFFGFDATFIDGVANINGDDAIELFENQQVIDVFGEIDVDGSGQPWEYLDGWAYRDNTTGPDGSTFVLDNWNFSGVDALQDVATNADAALPFPACEYSATPPAMLLANNDQAFTDANTSVTINILANDDIPDINGLTIAITMMPANGTVTVGNNDVTYTPAQDFCGQDQFVYELTAADGMTSSAEVYVDVACPTTYPPRTIDLLTTNDTDGRPDSLGQTAEISGIVYGVDLQGGSPVQFTVIDATGGIAVFSGNDFGYTVMEGDEVTLRGSVSQFNGLTQFSPDTIILVSSGNDLVEPLDVNTLDESTESELVRLCGLSFVSSNPTGASGINYILTDGSTEFTIRVDNDTEIFDAFNFEDNDPATEYCVTGIGGQFDNSAPFDEGYQLLPRYLSDIEIISSTQQVDYSNAITLFPHPLTDMVELRTDLTLEQIIVRNQLGQVLIDRAGNSRRIDVSRLADGLYTISFRTAEGTWSTLVVK